MGKRHVNEQTLLLCAQVLFNYHQPSRRITAVSLEQLSYNRLIIHHDAGYGRESERSVYTAYPRDFLVDVERQMSGGRRTHAEYLARTLNERMHALNGNRNKPKSSEQKEAAKKKRKEDRPKRNAQLTHQAAVLKELQKMGNQQAVALGRIIKGRGDYEMGRNVGAKIGTFLGERVHKWIATLLGHGDYAVHVPSDAIQQNSLVARNTTPSFSNDPSGAVTLKEHDYIGSFPERKNFNCITLPIDLSSSLTFPWAYLITRRFQQYRLDGCVFFATSLVTEYTTNITIGSVFGSVRYDVDSKPPANKREVMNALFCQTQKASQSAVFAVELKNEQTPTNVLKVRQPGTSTGDEQLYKIGFFDFCTEGAPADVNNAFDLSVAYDVKFYKKRLFNAAGFLCFFADLKGTTGGSLVYLDDTANVKQPRINNIGATLSGGYVYFPFDAEVGAIYFVYVAYNAAGANSVFLTADNATGLQFSTSFRNQSISSFASNTSGTNSGLSAVSLMVAVKIIAGNTISSPPRFRVNVGTGTAADSGNVMIVQMDPGVASGLTADPPQLYRREQFVDYLVAAEQGDEEYKGIVPNFARARMVDYVHAFRKDCVVDLNMVDRAPAFMDMGVVEALAAMAKFMPYRRANACQATINGTHGEWTMSDDVRFVQLNSSMLPQVECALRELDDHSAVKPLVAPLRISPGVFTMLPHGVRTLNREIKLRGYSTLARCMCHALTGRMCEHDDRCDGAKYLNELADRDNACTTLNGNNGSATNTDDVEYESCDTKGCQRRTHYHFGKVEDYNGAKRRIVERLIKKQQMSEKEQIESQILQAADKEVSGTYPRKARKLNVCMTNGVPTELIEGECDYGPHAHLAGSKREDRSDLNPLQISKNAMIAHNAKQTNELKTRPAPEHTPAKSTEQKTVKVKSTGAKLPPVAPRVLATPCLSSPSDHSEAKSPPPTSAHDRISIINAAMNELAMIRASPAVARAEAYRHAYLRPAFYREEEREDEYKFQSSDDDGDDGDDPDDYGEFEGDEGDDAGEGDAAEDGDGGDLVEGAAVNAPQLVDDEVLGWLQAAAGDPELPVYGPILPAGMPRLAQIQAALRVAAQEMPAAVQFMNPPAPAIVAVAPPQPPPAPPAPQVRMLWNPVAIQYAVGIAAQAAFAMARAIPRINDARPLPALGIPQHAQPDGHAAVRDRIVRADPPPAGFDQQRLIANLRNKADALWLTRDPASADDQRLVRSSLMQIMRRDNGYELVDDALAVVLTVSEDSCARVVRGRIATADARSKTRRFRVLGWIRWLKQPFKMHFSDTSRLRDAESIEPYSMGERPPLWAAVVGTGLACISIYCAYRLSKRLTRYAATATYQVFDKYVAATTLRGVAKVLDFWSNSLLPHVPGGMVAQLPKFLQPNAACCIDLNQLEGPLLVVVWAPISEELIKRIHHITCYALRKVGLPVPAFVEQILLLTSGASFGSIENTTNGYIHHPLVRPIGHAFTTLFSYTHGVAIHSAYNLGVVTQLSLMSLFGWHGNSLWLTVVWMPLFEEVGKSATAAIASWLIGMPHAYPALAAASGLVFGFFENWVNGNIRGSWWRRPLYHAAFTGLGPIGAFAHMRYNYGIMTKLRCTKLSHASPVHIAETDSVCAELYGLNPAPTHNDFHVTYGDPTCENTSKVYCYGGVAGFAAYVFRHCCHNEMLALCGRVGKALPYHNDPGAQALARNTWRAAGAQFIVTLAMCGMRKTRTPIPLEAWLSTFPPLRRGMLKSLVDKEVELYMPMVASAFIKTETMLKPLDNPTFKDPRWIQGCPPLLSIRTGPYLRKFAKRFRDSTCYAGGMYGEHRHLYYTCGRNNREIGDAFAQAIATVYARLRPGEKLAFFEDDQSRFDLHLNEYAFECLDRIYSTYLPAKVARALRRTDSSTGVAPTGTTYKVPYTMQSGWPDTSVGDTIANAVMKTSIHGVNRLWTSIICGDDSVTVTTDRELRARGGVRGIVRSYANFGMEVEASVKESAMDVEFCSARFYPQFQTYVLMPKPGKLLAKLLWDNTNRSTSDRLCWLRSIAETFLAFGRVDPVLEAFGYSMKIRLPSGPVLRDYNEYKLVMSHGDEPRDWLGVYAYYGHWYNMSAKNIADLCDYILMSDPFQMHSHPLLIHMANTDC